MIGKKLGHYEILEKLAVGGMDEVYRARDPRLLRDVAVKVLRADLARDLDVRSRFEREARAVAALSHPNILALHDIGTDGGRIFVVTEFLEGETLRDKLERGALPWRRAVEVAAAVADGLAAAHEKGISHRDVKPENLFITKDDRVKILDFGLAGETPTPAPESAQPLRRLPTEPSTVIGTAGYMSPEQVRGGATDGRSDVFALGSVLYEMVSGRLAFPGESPAEASTAILRDEPPSFLLAQPEAPSALDRIVRRCLEKDPETRLPSARELARSLRALETDPRWGLNLAIVAAVAIDDGIAEAHASLGFAKAFHDWDPAGAEQEFERALALNPSYALTHSWYATLLAAQGRTGEAQQAARRAQEIDPVSPMIGNVAGWIFYLAREYDPAVRECKKTLDLHPSFYISHWTLGRIYEEEGRSAEAIASFEKAAALSEGETMSLASLAHALARRGRRAEAEGILAELRARARSEYVSPRHLAIAALGLGRTEDALDHLGEALADRSPWLIWLRVDPFYDPLRSDARFAALVKKVGY